MGNSRRIPGAKRPFIYEEWTPKVASQPASQPHESFASAILRVMWSSFARFNRIFVVAELASLFSLLADIAVGLLPRYIDFNGASWGLFMGGLIAIVICTALRWRCLWY